ncbi:MAG: acylphosphatase [bacterium]
MNEDTKKITYLEIRISGRVQGVGFRYFVKRQADKLGLKGFCKNEGDESVLVFSSGEKENQDKFLEKLQRGPLFARVSKLEVKEVLEFQYENFKIK